MARRPIDKALVQHQIAVTFLSGSSAQAIAEGNNAAWLCHCGHLLIGRCYYQFGDTCYTLCPNCQSRYRVSRDVRKRADQVREF